ncbi:hypothetical protein VNI00_000204 [Paramarasmius palmivorus]|uniref:Uncharacterized protein n=1 Tax=Paramarasmius palmivorus TaxID=297713 RepID=A0AAW0EC30_9AGAR
MPHLNDETPEVQGLGDVFGGSAFTAGDDEATEKYIQAYEYTHAFAIQHADVLDFTALAFTPVRGKQIEIGRGNPMIGSTYVDADRKGQGDELGPYNAVLWQVTFREPTIDDWRQVEADRRMFFELFPPCPGVPLFLNECDKKQKVFETYKGFEVLRSVRERYDVDGFNMAYMEGPEGL